MSPRTGTPLSLAAAVSLLALAGCASQKAPPTAADGGVNVPPAWSTAASDPAPTPLAAWWQRFGDPALTALIEQALAANTSIASAQAALRQSRALAQAQQARLGPELGVSGSAQRSRTAAGASGNSFRTGFDASWEPDVFGGQRAARDAAAFDTQASAFGLGDVQVSVAAEVAQTFLTLRSAEQRLAIARENLASQEETLLITQWRVQAGLATSLQSEQARAAVEQTRAQVPALQTSIALARHQLALLTGRTVAGFTLAEGGALPQPADDLALAFPADTLRQRPDVRAAEARVAAAAQRVLQADAARYPRFSLSGSLGLSALTLPALGSGAVVSSLLAGVSLPVFDGGALRAQSEAQRAAFDEASESYRSAVLVALKDVEDALVSLQGDRERLAHLREAADAAGNAALLARQRYASGLVDFQTVLETQRTQLGAQDNVAATQADVASDHVRLYKALGGGWTPQAATTADRS